MAEKEHPHTGMTEIQPNQQERHTQPAAVDSNGDKADVSVAKTSPGGPGGGGGCGPGAGKPFGPGMGPPVQYPTGLKLFSIIAALYLAGFLTALVRLMPPL